MHFVDNSLQDTNFTTEDILTFLYNGPEEQTETGLDWRNLFNTTDQIIRTFNRYGEVRNLPRLCASPPSPCANSCPFPGLDVELLQALRSSRQTVASVFLLRSQPGPFETEQAT